MMISTHGRITQIIFAIALLHICEYKFKWISYVERPESVSVASIVHTLYFLGIPGVLGGIASAVVAGQ